MRLELIFLLNDSKKHLIKNSNKNKNFVYWTESSVARGRLYRRKALSSRLAVRRNIFL